MFSLRMELRKDPITRSWVITGDDVTDDFDWWTRTSPTAIHGSEILGYWKPIDEDYHWHFEILPILGAKAKSYTFKEVYYSPVASETAVKRLRDAKIDS